MGLASRHSNRQLKNAVAPREIMSSIALHPSSPSSSPGGFGLHQSRMEGLEPLDSRERPATLLECGNSNASSSAKVRDLVCRLQAFDTSKCFQLRVVLSRQDVMHYSIGDRGGVGNELVVPAETNLRKACSCAHAFPRCLSRYASLSHSRQPQIILLK